MARPWPHSTRSDLGSSLELPAFARPAGPAQLTRPVATALGPLLDPDDQHAAAIAVAADTALPAEGYRLEITEERISIAAADSSGAFYAAMTLRQLLGPDAMRARPPRRGWVLPAGRIEDAPALAWRGAMLDPARYFVTKAEVLRFIDTMALHKLNRLHLHLSDDQGWRVECPSFPELIEVGAWRPSSPLGRAISDYAGAPWTQDGTPHGGYYSTADLAEIVGYAADRAIVIVPEIDLPGHAHPLIAAIPELAVPGLPPATVSTVWGVHRRAVSPLPEAMAIVEQILGEVADAISSPYFHVGGDEVRLDDWRGSSEVAAYMREQGLAEVRELRRAINLRLTDVVRGLGRRPIVWDEAFVDGGLGADTIVMPWRTLTVGVDAARAGHDVIANPLYPTYINFGPASDEREPLTIGTPLPLETVAGWDPLAAVAPEDRAHVLGVQGQLWGEYIDNARLLDYLAYPRLSALAEIGWTGRPALLDDGGFDEQLARLTAFGVEFRPLAGPLPWQQGGIGMRRFIAGNDPADVDAHFRLVASDSEPEADSMAREPADTE